MNRERNAAYAASYLRPDSADPAKALAYATLALVEQQRIANLIALAQSDIAEASFPAPSHLAQDALLTWAPAEDKWKVNPKVVIRPEIAAALGITQTTDTPEENPS